MDLTALKSAPRLLLTATLQPVLGTRFQPTGFSDIGHAQYLSADGVKMLIVESAQSTGNHLEAVCLDDASRDWKPPLQGLPYVIVKRKDGSFLTSSLLEAHRLNSIYIKRSDQGRFHKTLIKELAYDESAPIDQRKFAETVLRYDINSLIHGLFLESIGGRLRLPRALTGFIDASNVNTAASGGVKDDNIDPSKKLTLPTADNDVNTKSDDERRGNVPFHRDEFTGNVTAFFNLDLAQIRGYGLGEAVENLLVAIALYKIRALIDAPFRPRTACDLEVTGVTVKRPDGYALPTLAEISAALPGLIKAASSHFASPAVTTVVFE